MLLSARLASVVSPVLPSTARVAAWLLVAASLLACTPKHDGASHGVASASAVREAATPSSAVAASAASPAASAAVREPEASAGESPLARLRPPDGPRQPSGAALSLVPGVSFGPVALGDTLDDLRRANLTVSDEHHDVAIVQIPTAGGAKVSLHVAMCQEKIIDIWLDDLRTTPKVVSVGGDTIAPDMPREALEAKLGGCASIPPRIGGAFESCQGGGVFLGHGMGTFLQLRVRPKGWVFDGACEVARDDGSMVALTEAERTQLFRQVLNASEISPYWHPDKPGRDPLRIVKSVHLPEQPLTMFGSPVVFVEEAEAIRMGKKLAYLRVLRLDATSSSATVVVTYPVEGITATSTFRRRRPGPDGFTLERTVVVEK